MAPDSILSWACSTTPLYRPVQSRTGHRYTQWIQSNTKPANQPTGKSASGSSSAVSSPTGAIADVDMGSNGARRPFAAGDGARNEWGALVGDVSEVMLERVNEEAEHSRPFAAGDDGARNEWGPLVGDVSEVMLERVNEEGEHSRLRLPCTGQARELGGAQDANPGLARPPPALMTETQSTTADPPPPPSETHSYTIVTPSHTPATPSHRDRA
ncbi:hypothetical protein V495_04139, partial [Pseudogymnoascus sp. VKM F-4514 (FW-929)]